jgi:TPP-dependent pyruvate/acetoin dehydrogenase alpha subunit
MTSVDGIAAELSAEQELGLLRRMTTIRQFETRGMLLFGGGEIKGSYHSSAGQEAVSVGVCSQLAATDYVCSNHRGHGHTIAKGVDLKRLMAELMGRVEGYCRGRGGSMHVADFEQGMLGANGIVGGGVPIACGAAYASQLKGDGRVAVVFFGDGALGEGIVWESMNIAALWKLPVVFVCENNQFAVSLRVADGFAAERIASVPQSFGVPSVSVDGMKLLEVHAAAAEAIARARNGEGPSFIEALTYRFTGHSRGDPIHGPYRTKAEWQEWVDQDPIPQFAAAVGLEGELERLTEEADALVEEAVEFGRGCTFPSLDVAYEDVLPSQVASR